MSDQHVNEQTQSNSTQVLQALSRQADTQQLQLQLEGQFKRNMEAFKTIAPQIYEQFIDYQPQELRLAGDSGILVVGLKVRILETSSRRFVGLEMRKAHLGIAPTLWKRDRSAGQGRQ